MPARQRGSVVKRGGTWHGRYRDENGVQRTQGGFSTKTAAGDWLENRIKEVAALRRGDLIPAEHRPATVDALLDMFLDRHGRTIDPATVRKLTTQLRQARAVFAPGTQIR